MLASNDGNRSAAMTFGELEVWDSRYGVTSYKMNLKDGSFIVNPGEAKQVDLVFADAEEMDRRHMSWIREGIEESNWVESQGFQTESNLQIFLVQHSAFASVFDGQQIIFDEQQIKRAENALPTKISDNASRNLLMEPEGHTVELIVDTFDIFPWLWRDVMASIEIVPKTE